MIKVGNKIVYRDEVCTIVNIDKKYRDDEDYLVLKSHEDESLTIRVSASSATATIRPLITKKKVKELIKKIPDIPTIEIGKHSRGEEYKKLLKSGSHEDVVTVIKTCLERQQERIEQSHKPNEQDKVHFRQAEKRLYGEIASALDITIEEARAQISPKFEIATEEPVDTIDKAPATVAAA